MSSLTITYGRKGGPRSGHIREGRRGVAAPAFSVTPGETPPLRLNTDVGLRFQSDQLAKLPGNREKLDYLRFEVLGALDLFAQYQRRFLESYFAFITERCRAAADTLARRLAWSGGLFQPEDYVFSALWPLPDVEFSQVSGTGSVSLGLYDFAFWTGRCAIGVRFTGGVAPPDDAHRTGDPKNPVLPVMIAAGALADPVTLFAAPRFPPEFTDFWSAEPVPCSPFRPVGLAEMAAPL